MFEICGLEKTSLTLKEAEQVITIARAVAEENGYQVPEYILVLFVEDKEYNKMLKNSKHMVEIDDGELVDDGHRVVIKGSFLPIKLLEKIFLGLMTAFHYNTFLAYDTSFARNFLREKFLYFLSLIYGRK